MKLRTVYDMLNHKWWRKARTKKALATCPEWARDWIAQRRYMMPLYDIGQRRVHNLKEWASSLPYWPPRKPQPIQFIVDSRPSRSC